MTMLSELDTPAVTILLDRMEANIERVQRHLARHGLANRPHIKTHKIPAIAKMQVDAGAVGITCQKVGEVEVFVDAGVCDDILLTFNIIGDAKAERLMAQIKRIGRLAVVLDNEVVARGLSRAAVRHGADVRFLVECDTGYGRNGVQTPDAALELARLVMDLPRMQFDGLMTFPNKAPDTADFLERALELFKRAGIRVPVVSGGGTPALASVGQFPDDDRASGRDLRLQRRDDGVLGRRHLAGLRDARPSDGGQPSGAGPRHSRCRLQGADLGPVLRPKSRPHRGIPGCGDREPVGRACDRRSVGLP